MGHNYHYRERDVRNSSDQSHPSPAAACHAGTSDQLSACADEDDPAPKRESSWGGYMGFAASAPSWSVGAPDMACHAPASPCTLFPRPAFRRCVPLRSGGAVTGYWVGNGNLFAY